MSTENLQTCYIVKTPNVCGGEPRIANSRIKVNHIVGEYVHKQMSPYQIWEAHPHITLAEIHAALSYYYDHRREIDRAIIANEDIAEQMEKEQKSRSS